MDWRKATAATSLIFCLTGCQKLQTVAAGPISPPFVGCKIIADLPAGGRSGTQKPKTVPANAQYFQARADISDRASVGYECTCYPDLHPDQITEYQAKELISQNARDRNLTITSMHFTDARGDKSLVVHATTPSPWGKMTMELRSFYLERCSVMVFSAVTDSTAAPAREQVAAYLTSVRKDDVQRPTTPASEKREARPIAIQWDGYEMPIAATINLEQSGRAGSFHASLPNGEGNCDGTYNRTADGSGSWAIGCTNGLTAAGAFRALGAGKGASGSGVDSRGRKLIFTMGGT